MKLTTLLAGAIGAVTLALLVVTLTVGGSNPTPSGPPDAVGVGIVLAMLMFSVTGLFLATRLPGNPIGWLFLVIGLGFQMSFGLEEYAVRALVVQPGSLPAGIWAAWVASWAFTFWFGPMPLVLLLFPDGRLPSPRWRPVLILVIVGTAAQALALAFRPGPFGSEQLAAYSNPLGVEGIAPLADLIQGGPFIGVGFILCAIAAITRFRRARALERQQLKLFAFSAGLVTTILIALLLVQPVAGLLGIDARGLDDLLWISFISSFGAIAVAVTVAILRYRLYDIDLLINRTVVYGATSAAIATTFFTGIVALQAVLSPVTSGSELAVAASTLVSFALFQPIRRRVQDAADRRFDRSRYDAAWMLDDFADRLRDEVDLESLRAELIAAVGTTMAPAHASLWLRERTG